MRLSLCCNAEEMRDQDYPADVICSDCCCEFVEAPQIIDIKPIAEAISLLDKALSADDKAGGG
jgi:hypothetical protein